jgi:hypothetical protein
MASMVMDLLPRDAELARRAAGGDGAAFVRLYDRYSTDVFATGLAATGSVDAAAEATQTAFLRILRWPPALGAPDNDVEELLFALALGGPHERFDASPRETDHKVAQLVGVGWLRSETVSKAGARYDADWSVHLWSPSDGQAAEPEPSKPARGRRALRLKLRMPSPAAAGAALLLFLTAASGTLVIGGGRTDPMDAAPASARGEQTQQAAPSAYRRQRAEVRDDSKDKPAGDAKPLRDRTVGSLLAP